MSDSGEQGALDKSTDVDMASRIAAGDRAAENEFVRKYQRGVRVLVRRHCRPDDPIVDDLTQQVLAHVLESLRSAVIRDAAALPAYIQATVVHSASAEYRSRRRTESAVILEEMPSEEDPTERLSSSQLRQLVQTLLDRLPVMRDREVLARFYLREQDKSDVCRELGIDVAHFHRVTYRARERFREMLYEAGIRSI